MSFSPRPLILASEVESLETKLNDFIADIQRFNNKESSEHLESLIQSANETCQATVELLGTLKLRDSLCDFAHNEKASCGIAEPLKHDEHQQLFSKLMSRFVIYRDVRQQLESTIDRPCHEILSKIAAIEKGLHGLTTVEKKLEEGRINLVAERKLASGMNSQISKLRHQLHDEEQERECLGTKLAFLEKSCNELHSSIELMSTTIANQAAKHDKYQEEIAGKDSKIASLLEINNRLNAQKDPTDLKKTIIELKAYVDDNNTFIESNKNHIQQLEADLVSKEAIVGRIQGENDALSRMTVEINKKRELLKESNGRYKRRNSEIQQEYKEKTMELKAAKEEARLLKNKWTAITEYMSGSKDSNNPTELEPIKNRTHPVQLNPAFRGHAQKISMQNKNSQPRPINLQEVARILQCLTEEQTQQLNVHLDSTFDGEVMEGYHFVRAHFRKNRGRVDNS